MADPELKIRDLGLTKSKDFAGRRTSLLPAVLVYQ